MVCKEKLKAEIMDKAHLQRALTRIAHEIVERNEGTDNIALIGIIRRGETLAHLLAEEIKKIQGRAPQIGTLDISFYRDDIVTNVAPVLHATDIPFEINDMPLILVDDVLYTGRTIRAALDALMDFGRPRSVQLAVMVDRGHRELPIRADYVGKNVPSSHQEDVRVYLEPADERTSVEIWDRSESQSERGGQTC